MGQQREKQQHRSGHGGTRCCAYIHDCRLTAGRAAMVGCHARSLLPRTPTPWHRTHLFPALPPSTHSKFKGMASMPNCGYGTNKKDRHVLPNGFLKFVVHNVGELELLMMHNRCVGLTWVWGGGGGRAAWAMEALADSQLQSCIEVCWVWRACSAQLRSAGRVDRVCIAIQVPPALHALAESPPLWLCSCAGNTVPRWRTTCLPASARTLCSAPRS